MKIVIEEYSYEASMILPILSERYYIPLQNQRVKVNYVGYYFEPDMSEPVMILPKVFYENNRVFGKYTPEEIFDLDNHPGVRASLRKDGKLDFLFTITTWMYLAIRQFQKRQPINSITEESHLAIVVSTLGEKDVTELDIVLGLIRFNNENQSLFTFIKKTNTAHNQQVSWHKTITKKTPMLQNGGPVYVSTIVSHKTLNQDEELLVILTSVLHYFNQKYYLQVSLNPMFMPYKGKELENLMIRGTLILKQIKYKYFSDKLLKLWDLLYVFFNRQDKIKHQKYDKEILLVRDFNIVFEDMIDALLSEPNLPKHLKSHKDGKEIDHIYPYQDLLTNQDKIYHIGDSKYYKDNTQTGKNAIAKQYTYAKNVIQYNIDVLNEGGQLLDAIRYRDDLTEGYNITPNFFISAVLNGALDFQKERLEYKENFKQNKHFPDRLFDRDTLILQTYNINFLYVINTYIANNQVQKDKFKLSTRSLFREKMIIFLDSKYSFYEVRPLGGLEEFVAQNFKILSGKMYRPSGWEGRLLLAFEKNNENGRPTIKGAEITEYLITNN